MQKKRIVCSKNDGAFKWYSFTCRRLESSQWFFIFEGIIALSVFLVVASFSIHKFWQEKDREMMLMEAMHFSKNWAILFELVFIASIKDAF
jgi:hypothetical protein